MPTYATTASLSDLHERAAEYRAAHAACESVLATEDPTKPRPEGFAALTRLEAAKQALCDAALAVRPTVKQAPIQEESGFRRASQAACDNGSHWSKR